VFLHFETCIQQRSVTFSSSCVCVIQTVLVTDIKANRLMSVLFGNISSEVGSKLTLVSPEGHTFTVEVAPSVDDKYQLILRGTDLRLLAAARLALINRLQVS